MKRNPGRAVIDRRKWGWGDYGGWGGEGED